MAAAVWLGFATYLQTLEIWLIDENIADRMDLYQSCGASVGSAFFVGDDGLITQLYLNLTMIGSLQVKVVINNWSFYGVDHNQRQVSLPVMVRY